MVWVSAPPVGTPLDLAHPDNRGLTLHAPINEGAGIGCNDLLGGASGVLSGVAQSSTSGWSGSRAGGSSLLFDGTDDRLVFTRNIFVGATMAPFSVEFWVKPFSTAGGEHWALNLTAGGTNWWLFLYQGSAQWVLKTQTNLGDQQDNGSNFYLLQWQQITITYDGDAVRWYVNGMLQTTRTGITTRAQSAATSIALGATTTGGIPFNGAIQGFRCYNIALPLSTIQCRIQSPFAVFQAPSVRKWYVAAGGGGGTTNARLVNAGLLRGGMLIGGRLAA